MDVVVRPDGKISLPQLNDVQAAGLTPDQLREGVLAAATKFYVDPSVNVVVKQINSRKFYITGEVAKPVRVPADGTVDGRPGDCARRRAERVRQVGRDCGDPDRERQVDAVSRELQGHHEGQEHAAEHRAACRGYGRGSVAHRSNANLVGPRGWFYDRCAVAGVGANDGHGWSDAKAGERALFGGGVGNAEQVLSMGSNAGVSFFQTLTDLPPSRSTGEAVPTTTRISRGVCLARLFARSCRTPRWGRP